MAEESSSLPQTRHSLHEGEKKHVVNDRSGEQEPESEFERQPEALWGERIGSEWRENVLKRKRKTSIGSGELDKSSMEKLKEEEEGGFLFCSHRECKTKVFHRYLKSGVLILIALLIGHMVVFTENGARQLVEMMQQFLYVINAINSGMKGLGLGGGGHDGFPSSFSLVKENRTL